MRYLPFHVNASMPLAVRIAVPLAASALLAAGCASSTSPSSSGAGSSQAPTSAAATGGAAAAVTVDEHTGPDGTYLTDDSGRTLYLFMADTGASSNCSGACATTWPPLTATGAAAAGSGVTMSDLGTITRSDGTKQVTYDGHPLYYFAHDGSAGQTNGQGINGYGAQWWIVSPAGAAITTMAGGGASTPAPSGSSSKSGSSWS